MHYLHYMQTRPELIEGLRLYAEEGVIPGSFLTAVLHNNLMEAFAYADQENKVFMHHVVTYIYNHIPRGCWGSPEIVRNWVSEIRSLK